ncbi:MAG TPA: glycine--tRNA ligase [Nitriliruptorales bacterium]|nr:glycine--tRNA ligase [Nitriliruptorales bacterium]
MASKTDRMDTIVSLAKRRGLVFPSSEIYGGLRSTWDYGPIGVELKNNVKRQWWRAMVQLRDDIVGQDAAILMAPQVWEASGHVAGFTDPLVECTRCHRRFREDHIEADPRTGVRHCPDCGGELGVARQFNLMFKTFAGPVQDDSAVVWLRPETAQGIFVDFPTVQLTNRMKVPFGVAQIGKSFRNEITPGNFTYRTREFEQMEMEFFCHPDSADEWFEHWKRERWNWYVDLGLREPNLRMRPHDPDELSHYSSATVDIEYHFSDPAMGWSELEGIANRTDFDLKAHQQHSGKDMSYYDQEHDERYHPYVIEPAAGADRAALAFLFDAYREEEAPDAKGQLQRRVVLRLDRRLAPYKVAVLPLSKKDELITVSRRVFDLVKTRWMAEHDVTQSIGRRYRRQDEIGTPLCVTVDFTTLEDDAVTVRDRDTMAQDRVSIDRLFTYLTERLPL